MPFNNNPKQRAAYFAKKKLANPLGNPAVQPIAMQPSNTPPASPAVDPVKVPGLPKMNKFGRIRRMFKV